MIKLENNLINETSPYLLQHAKNPVQWYPWGEEAFTKAKTEDKPIFLSIGYSTCHWCHVMAHECFEDVDIANILNRGFISIKVDKEERPDIDNIYMTVCQAFTGSGGWPTTIFMTPEQKPFFAGTYFPKKSTRGMLGFGELLERVLDKWQHSRGELLQASEEVMAHLSRPPTPQNRSNGNLADQAASFFAKTFDKTNGGFGSAPKFPSPHNLLFLLAYGKLCDDADSTSMAEKTLVQMYRGGLFDHMGYGFSRYSTDKYFLVPHFEKMLYDNALLMMSYQKAYALTQNPLYLSVAEKAAAYILREMTAPEGGFYSAQDADSEGVEGKYYVFSEEELPALLGAEIGEPLNDYYGITKEGNFEGKSIPNLLHNRKANGRFDAYLPEITAYRKSRAPLHLDDKVLCAWNGLMIGAFAGLYQLCRDDRYRKAAEQACDFVEKNLRDGQGLRVSWRGGTASGKGFLEDYAFYAFAQLALYDATLEEAYLQRAMELCGKAVSDFYDGTQGGFFLYGNENEQLILKPKETYDGAIPSGNSVMAYNLVRLFHLTKNPVYQGLAEQQINFMSTAAVEHPAGHSFFLLALMRYELPPPSVVCVLKDIEDRENLRQKIRTDIDLRILEEPEGEYQLLNSKTTYYVCRGHSCLPPTNDLRETELEQSFLRNKTPFPAGKD